MRILLSGLCTDLILISNQVNEWVGVWVYDGGKWGAQLVYSNTRMDRGLHQWLALAAQWYRSHLPL